MNAKRLPFRPLLCYSVGNVVLTAMYTFLGTFLLKFYTDDVGLAPAWIGIAFLVRNIIDAAIDPGIGYLSDRTRLPQGRRRPYFLIGTIPAAVLLYFVLKPPAGSQVVVFLYLTVTSTLMIVFLSIMGIVHLAMGFELTDDYDERTRIFGYKSFIENLTMAMTLMSVPVVASVSKGVFRLDLSRSSSYRVAALIVGAASIAAALIAYLGTAEFARPRSQMIHYRFWDGIVGTFRNRAFRILVAVFVLITIADRFAMSQLFIVLEQFHGIREEDSVGLLGCFVAGALLFVWPWVWLAQRFGKDRVLRLAIAIWPLASIAFVLSHWSSTALSMIAFAMGASGVGILTIIGAIAPDVLEYEQGPTDQRREGMYVSVGNVLFQVATAVGLLLSGQCLSLIGYYGQPNPSERVVTGLRLSFAAAPSLMSLGAFVAFAYFPVTPSSNK